MDAVHAKYESRCCVCQDRIFAGDKILPVEEDWAHEDCAHEVGFPDPNRSDEE